MILQNGREMQGLLISISDGKMFYGKKQMRQSGEYCLHPPQNIVIL